MGGCSSTASTTASVVASSSHRASKKGAINLILFRLEVYAHVMDMHVNQFDLALSTLTLGMSCDRIVNERATRISSIHPIHHIAILYITIFI